MTLKPIDAVKDVSRSELFFELFRWLFKGWIAWHLLTVFILPDVQSLQMRSFLSRPPHLTLLSLGVVVCLLLSPMIGRPRLASFALVIYTTLVWYVAWYNPDLATAQWCYVGWGVLALGLAGVLYCYDSLVKQRRHGAPE